MLSLLHSRLFCHFDSATLDENSLKKLNAIYYTSTVIYVKPFSVHWKEQFVCTRNSKQIYWPDIHGREWIRTSHPKQSGCNKRLVVITDDVLAKFYCTSILSPFKVHILLQRQVNKNNIKIACFVTMVIEKQSVCTRGHS